MSELQIGKKKIGNGYPVYIIAEGCDNHMGDVEVAKEMCRQAKLAGADCIKFQHHLPDEEMLSDAVIAGKNNIPLYEFLKQHALTLKQHRELMEYCKKIGIQYLCTPFSLKAAYELDAMGVDAFKIGSGEMTDIPTLVRIARLGKPMIVSTGMSTIEEIRRTYDVLNQTGVSLAFTNCISEYPPKYEDINLKFILQMEKHFPDAIIGHSDHTPDLYTSFGAVTLGARIIEKHVILDKRTPGPDQSVSIDFQELHQLVDGIRKLEDALGSVKKVHPGEEETRSWAFRSLVTKRPIKKGQRIEEDMIWSKRPGTGIPAYRMKEIIGKYAATDIDENVLEYESLNLILQPLVENAIEHGIDLLTDRRGVITVVAKLHNGLIHIEVKDNGIGMPKETAHTFLTSESGGYGARNVNDRIRLFYGEQYNLKVSSDENGTVITIEFPARKPV